jgi:hypothetical protein
MNETASIRPSKAYYWLAAPFLVLGVGLFVYLLFHELSHLTDSLTQVVVPGSADLKLSKGPIYTVFLEEKSVVDGKIYATRESVNGLTCNIKSQANGNTIGLRRPGMSTTYTVGGRSGRSVLEFSVPEDGEYHFACSYKEGSQGPEAVLAVGSGVGEKIVKTVLSSLAAIFGGGGIAGCIVVVVTILRVRTRKHPPPPVQSAT